MHAVATAPIELDETLKARIRRLAEERGRTPVQIVEDALIAMEQKREEKTAVCEMSEERKAWYQEGVHSWREFQETGLHLTLDEVGDWLATWGTDHEKDPPPCHK